jgi:hypothetical protein
MVGNDQPPADMHRAPAAQEVLVDERNGSWTEAMVRRPQANLEYPAARAVLDLCSERSPEEVTLEDVVERAGIRDTDSSPARSDDQAAQAAVPVEHLADLGAVDRYWPSELLDEA